MKSLWSCSINTIIVIQRDPSLGKCLSIKHQNLQKTDLIKVEGRHLITTPIKVNTRPGRYKDMTVRPAWSDGGVLADVQRQHLYTRPGAGKSDPTSVVSATLLWSLLLCRPGCQRGTWKGISTLKSTQAPTLAPTTYSRGLVNQSYLEINKNN